MSDAELERLIKLLNPSFTCKLPDVGNGLAATAGYTRFYEQRMLHYRQPEPAQQPASTPTMPLEIAIDAATRHTLQSIAEQASTPGKPLDTRQVATAVLQNAVGKITASAADLRQVVAELQHAPASGLARSEKA